MQPTLNIALRAARAAAEKLKFDFEQKPAMLDSGISLEEFMSKTIEEVSVRLIKSIRKSHPDHNIEILETGIDKARTPDEDVLWRIRILEGVSNYLTGYPAVMIAVAFQLKGKIQHIALVNPISGEEFTCSRGRGMHHNEMRVRVSNTKKLNQLLLSTHDFDLFDERFKNLAQQKVQFRSTGSFLTDVAYCCSGKTQAMIAQKVPAFEMELASLFAQESGALTGDLNGKPSKSDAKEVMLTNPKLFKLLVQSFNNI